MPSPAQAMQEQGSSINDDLPSFDSDDDPSSASEEFIREAMRQLDDTDTIPATSTMDKTDDYRDAYCTFFKMAILQVYIIRLEAYILELELQHSVLATDGGARNIASSKDLFGWKISKSPPPNGHVLALGSKDPIASFFTWKKEECNDKASELRKEIKTYTEQLERVNKFYDDMHVKVKGGQMERTMPDLWERSSLDDPVAKLLEQQFIFGRAPKGSPLSKVPTAKLSWSYQQQRFPAARFSQQTKVMKRVALEAQIAQTTLRHFITRCELLTLELGVDHEASIGIAVALQECKFRFPRKRLESMSKDPHADEQLPNVKVLYQSILDDKVFESLAELRKLREDKDYQLVWETSEST